VLARSFDFTLTISDQVVTGSTEHIKIYVLRQLPTVLSCLRRPALEAGLWRGLHRYKPGLLSPSLEKQAIFLPDKEFRYFNTVIVTADVHWRLAHSALPHLATRDAQVKN